MIPGRRDAPDTRVSGSTPFHVGLAAESGKKVKRSPADGLLNRRREETLAPSVLRFALHPRSCRAIPRYKRNDQREQVQWLPPGRSDQIRQRPHRIPSHHFIRGTCCRRRLKPTPTNEAPFGQRASAQTKRL